MKKSIFLIILLVVIVFAISSISNMDKTILKDEVIVTIKPGNGAKAIANELKSKNIIKSRWLFVNHVKKNNVSTQLKPGTYKFEAGQVTFEDILNKLLKGEQEEQITVTIPEGYTVAQIAKLLSDKGIVEEETFLDCASNFDAPYEYIPKGNDYRKLEGFLFPDTYQIPVSWKEDKIISMFLEEFNSNWTKEFDDRAKELGMSVDEIITLASLIEREAKIDSERATISSVIHNRLKIDMLLQIDATVQYLLPKQKERLLYKDLEVDSPYNTYKYAGLPPTAIGAPGVASIKAALYPENTSYYYYRAKANGNGEHWFTKSFNEHNSYAGK